MVAVNEANERAAVEAEKARRKRKQEEQKAWEGESLVSPSPPGAWPFLTRPGHIRWGSSCCLTRLARRRAKTAVRTDADAMLDRAGLLTSLFSYPPDPHIPYRQQSVATNALATGATTCTRRRSARSRSRRRTCTFWGSRPRYVIHPVSPSSVTPVPMPIDGDAPSSSYKGCITVYIILDLGSTGSGEAYQISRALHCAE
jgi:hypothetical protein